MFLIKLIKSLIYIFLFVLQDASTTDGKAAMSLEKLKLFRHFYIMVVCYVYMTRIVVYLLRITIPFQAQYFHSKLYILKL